MSHRSICDYTERQSRAANRVLDMLENNHQRTDSVYSRQRIFERKFFRSQVTISLIGDTIWDPVVNGSQGFTVWSYSLSRGGAGFIALEQINQDELMLGVHLPGGTRWMHGHIVRRRAIPEEEFIDYGVAFRSNDSSAVARPGAAATM
jgi:hypothetical protein